MAKKVDRQETSQISQPRVAMQYLSIYTQLSFYWNTNVDMFFHITLLKKRIGPIPDLDSSWSTNLTDMTRDDTQLNQ